MTLILALPDLLVISCCWCYWT